MPLLRDYKVKLIVFVFAIFIWFFVVTENEYEYDIEIPLAPVNLPAGKVILNDLPKTVKVKIKGNGKDLIALSLSGGARLELDLSGVEDSRVFHLDPKYVMLSRPIGSVTSTEIVMPDTVRVVLDAFTSRRVPVRPRIVLTPAPGYTVVGDFQVKPDSVDVSGAQSLVEQIEAVETEARTFSDLTFDLRQVLPLAPLRSDKLACSVQQVEVFADVQKLLEMTVNNVPVQVRNAPRGVRVTVIPSTLSLVLRGGGDLLTQLSRDQIVAYVDYNRVRNLPGQAFPAVIELPPDIEYGDVRPRTFKLVLQKPGKR